MNPIEYKITLDCRRAESQVIITAKQGEASGRKITFSLNEGRLPYKVPSGVTAVLRAKKPSGAVLYNTCTVTADGNIEYIITTQTVAEVGKLPCELQLSQDGKVIFSPNFTLLVYKNLSVDSEVESSDEFTALQAAISRAESLTDGTTFTPTVSEDGVLSWTNDGGKANPDPVNIKGPQGEKGEGGAFRINVTSSNGVYSADKTFDEIKAAYEAGQQPFVVLTGGTFDLVYTLANFDAPTDGSEPKFVDFERYLIGEDTLETETLRIYSYTLANGSNIVKRTSSFDVPSGSVVIEGTASDDLSEVTITTPDAWTLVSKAWNSEKRPLVVLRLSDELCAYLTSVSTMTVDGQSQGMALFSLPPVRHLGSTPPYSIWLGESGGAAILPVESINGADGIGIQSVTQTTTSTEDGGANIITVTKTDGTSSTFTVKNGSKGSTGATGAAGKDGYTPVKGTDYWTADDIAAIQSYIDEKATVFQTKSITDGGGHFTSDTVEGALQEVGAELAGINTLLGSGIQISFTIDDGGSDSETFSVISGTTWAEWIGTGRLIFNDGLVLYIYGGVVATEAGVYAVSLDGSTAVSGGDEIVSGATYTIINWGG